MGAERNNGSCMAIRSLPPISISRCSYGSSVTSGVSSFLMTFFWILNDFVSLRINGTSGFAVSSTLDLCLS